MRQAIQGLYEADQILLTHVEQGDSRLDDAAEVQLDTVCNQIIAKRQPTATIVRIVIGVPKDSASSWKRRVTRPSRVPGPPVSCITSTRSLRPRSNSDTWPKMRSTCCVNRWMPTPTPTAWLQPM